MPVADITDARDLVLAMLKTAWDSQMTPPNIFWDDQEENSPFDTYAVATFRHTMPSGQSSLTGDAGTRYTSGASLIVDIYTLFGSGAKAADPYTKLIQLAFRGQKSIPDKVWFRAVRLAEQPRFGKHAKMRVVVDFQYDEVF